MLEEDESNIRGGETDMDLYTPVDSLVMPDSSASENLLLDTIVRIRIATKLIKPMLTELPGEVRKLMIEQEERVEKWKSWHDSAAEDAKNWQRDAQKMFGIMHNDILSAMDDCIELGMSTEQMRSVVKMIIEKTSLPDKA